MGITTYVLIVQAQKTANFVGLRLARICTLGDETLNGKRGHQDENVGGCGFGHVIQKGPSTEGKTFAGCQIAGAERSPLDEAPFDAP
jgi:hypothetical protein